MKTSFNPCYSLNLNRTSTKHKNVFYYKNDSLEISQKKYPRAISFCGITEKGVVKQRGLMLHITSLPAHNSFCGQFGDEETKNFIDWLAKAKQTHWIMNPLNSLKEDLCPYNSNGRFSHNKFIINLNKLASDEYGNLLNKNELPDDIPVTNFTFEMLEKQKNPRFKLAYSRFKELPESNPLKQEFNIFKNENEKLWLNDYANYDALSKKYGDNWHDWDYDLVTAPENAKQENKSLNEKIIEILKQKDSNFSEKEYGDLIGQFEFEQFLYNKQFSEMTNYMDSKGIHLILDLPIGVSPDGVDVWANKNMFLLDKDFKPSKVSGCPPENMYPYTQVWGHALYNYDSPEFWEYQEASVKQLLKNADLRLDHFVGYVNRAEIPETYTKPDGKVLKSNEIFKPVNKGGMGEDFFLNEWISDISQKRNKNGENMFEVFIRLAKENGKKPEDTFILEDFGPLANTEKYKNFRKKYGDKFISQEVPISTGNKEFSSKIKNTSAILTGNHDMPSLKETVDKLIDGNISNNPISNKIIQMNFRNFCKKELKLDKEEINNRSIVYDNLMKWYYTRDVKQVQTTIQDALGLYFRPNIPGHWLGSEDNYLMKPTPEALLPYWSKVLPRDFLVRENKSGINPGYKSNADKFVKMMSDMYD